MISQNKLKELLHYNPETGVFIWVDVAKNQIKNGDIAGSRNQNGYIEIMIAGKVYKAHRLAWFYVHGEWPKDQVDHINQKRNDNRIVNIRAVPRSVNLKNKRMGKNNVSGIVGVHWAKAQKKWRATIKVDGKYISLGYFSDKEDAKMVRKDAEIKYGFHENHGNSS